MRFAWLVIAAFGGRFFATALYFPQGDGDLGWQRWLGARILATGALPQRLGAETFTASGAPWIPHEWLFAVLAFASRGVGWLAFAGVCAACAVVALVLVGRDATRRGAHPYAVAVAVAAAAVALLESFGVRVQVFAWPLFAAFLLVLETDGPFAYAAVAIAAAWSNVHASVVLAPVLAAASFAGTWLDEGWTQRARRTLVIAALSGLATCANPLGWRIPTYAVTLFVSPFKSMITEWKHTDLGDTSFAFGALPLLLVVVAFGVRGERRWRDRAVLAVVGWLMLSAARNVAIFGLAAAPIAASALAAGMPYLRDRRGTVAFAAPIRAMRVVEGCLIVAMAVGVAASLVRMEQSGVAPEGQPMKALAAIRALPRAHNVFCADFAWCGFLLASRERVFLDGRADPYPQPVWDAFATIVRVRPSWRKTLRDRNVDVVLVGRTAPLEAALSLTRGWRSVYVDHDFRVWLRAGAEHPGVRVPEIGSAR